MRYGARPLRRLIQTSVEDALSDLILRGEAASGDRVTVTERGGQIVLKVKKAAEIDQAARRKRETAAQEETVRT